MLHTVYIYDKDKKLVGQGVIYCSDYCLFENGNYMGLITRSGDIVHTIRGSYIIVI